MKQLFYIHFTAIKNALATRMAYRGDFFISMLVMLLMELIIPLVTVMIYQNGASFPGWSLYEVLLIQGIFLLAKGIAFPFFFGIVWNTLRQVREGTFDLLLLKPRSALFMAIATGFDSEDLGKLLGGFVLFLVAVCNLPAAGFWEWLQFTILFALSLTVLFSFALIMSGSVFVWVGNSRVYEIFDAITAFGLYPGTIFGKSFQTLLTMVIPIAMLGFLPAAALLGKPSFQMLVGGVASLILLKASLWFWHKRLGKYSSAGG